LFDGFTVNSSIYHRDNIIIIIISRSSDINTTMCKITKDFKFQLLQIFLNLIFRQLHTLTTSCSLTNINCTGPSLPRDSMHECCLCCRACLSVRPSVTFVDSIKMNKRIFKIFSPSDSHTIQVILYQTLC